LGGAGDKETRSFEEKTAISPPSPKDGAYLAYSCTPSQDDDKYVSLGDAVMKLGVQDKKTTKNYEDGGSIWDELSPIS